MSEAEIEFPFEKLFVAVVGNTKRVYTSQGPARARITNAVGRNTNRFEHDCELWEIDNDGWVLILECSEGDHSDSIPWNEIAKTRKKADDRLRQWRKEREDAVDRLEYDRLRAKFEGN
jgi:hypothetical protein